MDKIPANERVHQHVQLSQSHKPDDEPINRYQTYHNNNIYIAAYSSILSVNPNKRYL